MLTYMRSIMAAMLLMGLSILGFGLFHVVRLPVDWGNRQALSAAWHCLDRPGRNCVQTIHGSVDGVQNDGGNKGTLFVLLNNGHVVSATAIQSLTTMARLSYGDAVELDEWRGLYVRVVTPAGSFDTVDNPNYHVYLDVGFGLGGLAIGSLITWLFGRLALGPLFIRLGWRRLAAWEDRDLDDLHHGRMPPARAYGESRATRWMDGHLGWVTAHPLLNFAYWAGLPVLFILLRLKFDSGSVHITPALVAFLGFASLVGALTSLKERRMAERHRHLDQHFEDWQRRAVEASRSSDEEARKEAILDLLQSMKDASSDRRWKRLMRRLETEIERKPWP